MREIEIKVRVSNSAQTLAALEELGIQLGKPKKQHDVVYARPGAIAADPHENWLRVRTENDRRVLFTLKRAVSSELDSIEHEAVVDSAAEITAIVRCLGYELFSDTTKVRRTAQYADTTLCFDEVAQLGAFMEAERVCQENVDLATIEAGLWHLMEQLGFTRADQETSGYDILIRKQVSGEV
ncbi:MAG TPA: class IV adenylate cyclase [Candidatus Saccharimonadales bacterium]|nr:class IV adenylate cyclase [Candidatus Saccharimonadales bacterium]